MGGAFGFRVEHVSLLHTQTCRCVRSDGLSVIDQWALLRPYLGGALGWDSQREARVEALPGASERCGPAVEDLLVGVL